MPDDNQKKKDKKSVSPDKKDYDDDDSIHEYLCQDSCKIKTQIKESRLIEKENRHMLHRLWKKKTTNLKTFF